MEPSPKAPASRRRLSAEGMDDIFAAHILGDMRPSARFPARASDAESSEPLLTTLLQRVKVLEAANVQLQQELDRQGQQVLPAGKAVDPEYSMKDGSEEHEENEVLKVHILRLARHIVALEQRLAELGH
eukprot:gene5254-5307_t